MRGCTKKQIYFNSVRVRKDQVKMDRVRKVQVKMGRVRKFKVRNDRMRKRLE
jgi:hypothetical protein